MNELTRIIVQAEGIQNTFNRPPKNAAALVLIDRTYDPPAILMGRRHKSHIFLPGKFVFPGGQVEKSDRDIPVSGSLDLEVEAKLKKRLLRPSKTIVSALAIAAIRETFEETGLMIGARLVGTPLVSKPLWNEFAKVGVWPDLSQLHFIARAITPPRYPRRFDTRFFAVDSSAIIHHMENIIHSDGELTELIWVPIPKAFQLDMPVVTGLVLRELQARIAAGYSHELPVPFYRMKYKHYVRELL